MNNRTTTIGKHKTAIYNDGDGFTRVVYHNTAVFKIKQHDDGTAAIILNSGGWKTATTKKRINQAAKAFNVPLYVKQEAFEWFVVANGDVFPFVDGNKLLIKVKP